MGEFNAGLEAATAVSVEPVVEPAPEPTPAPVVVPEPAAEPAPVKDDEGDRSAKYQEAMSELAGLLPEEKQHLLKNRAEQGVRWSRDELAAKQEIKALTERFGSIQEAASELAKTFPEGAAFLEQKGPVEFFKAVIPYADELFGSKEQEPQAAPVDSALSKRLETLEAHIAGQKRNQEERAAEEQLAADLSPLIQEALKGYGAEGEKAVEAEKMIGHLARLQYFGNAYNMPAGASTPARAVQEVVAMLDKIADARKQITPMRAKPQEITPAKGPDTPRGAKGYKDMQDTMFGDVSKDIEEASKIVRK